jgi:hypothetical protein
MNGLNNLKNLIKDNKVWFDSYRQGYFYYKINMGVVEDETGKKSVIGTFTVPLDDIGTATLMAEDKAINFMRWIRKAIESETLLTTNQ